jgi:hypothetical protein
MNFSRVGPRGSCTPRPSKYPSSPAIQTTQEMTLSIRQIYAQLKRNSRLQSREADPDFIPRRSNRHFTTLSAPRTIQTRHVADELIEAETSDVDVDESVIVVEESILPSPLRVGHSSAPNQTLTSTTLNSDRGDGPSAYSEVRDCLQSTWSTLE